MRLLNQLNVPGLSVSGLLRPAARMPEKQEESRNGSRSKPGEDGQEVLRGHRVVAPRRAGGFLTFLTGLAAM